MSKTLKNLLVILGFMVVAFGAYYIYNEFMPENDLVSNQANMQNMLNSTKEFIGHRQTLDAIKMDLRIFEDEKFTSLTNYSTPVPEVPVGRENPFEEVE